MYFQIFKLLFKMTMLQLKCYYCNYEHDKCSSVLQHLSSRHRDEPCKVKLYVMNETDGTLQLITEHYKYTPKELEEQWQWFVFDAEKKKVCKASIEVPVTTASSPVLKKARFMATFAPDGSTDGILFETEREFLHKILPTVKKYLHQSGFLQELIDCHQMLADNTFL